MTVEIILVEDDQVLRQSLTEYLELDGHQVVAVSSGQEYRHQSCKTDFKIAIIDIGLPDVCGFDLVEETSRHPFTKIIILTARDSIDDRIRGYQTGGHLYLCKPVDCRELSAAITSLKSTVQKQRAGSDEEAKRLWTYNASSWTLIAPDQKSIKLTAKEFKFINLLLAQPNQHISREELLTTLYSRDDVYTSQAFDVMVSRLRKKTKELSSHQLPLLSSTSEGIRFTAPCTHHS